MPITPEEDKNAAESASILLFSLDANRNNFQRLRKFGKLSLKLNEKRRQKVLKCRAFFQRMESAEAEELVRQQQDYLYEISQKQKKQAEEKRHEEVLHIMEFQAARRRALIKLKIN